MLKVAGMFNATVDTDLGLFKVLKKHFPSDVKESLLNNNDEKQIILELLSRTDINPLNAILKPEEDRDNESLLSIIFDSYYKEIIEASTVYDLFGLLVTYHSLSDIDVTILCESDYEAGYIKRLNPSIKVKLVNPDTINLSAYDALYIKYLIDLTKYAKGIRGINIYTASAMYNMMESDKGITLAPELVEAYGDLNRIKLIDLYRNVKWRVPAEEEADN